MSKVAYTVGRFQPPTIGHRMLIDATIAAAEGGEAYVFVSKTVDKQKSPLPPDLKVRLLRKMFQGKPVQFINTAECESPCGGPEKAMKWLVEKGKRPEDIALVIGKERLGDPTSKEYFGPEAPLWGETPKPSSFIPVGHSVVRNPDPEVKDAANMSGTKARGYVCNERKSDFYMALGFPESPIDSDVEAAYKIIDGIICNPPTSPPPSKRRRTAGATDEEGGIPTGGPDGEPPSGGHRKHKKTRRTRKTRKHKTRKH
jgi:hypothetical protein